MAAKKKELGLPKGTPTYPLSPRTMEIIVHAAHDGKNWIDLPKEAGKGEVLSETGIDLLHYIGRLELKAQGLNDRAITIHANAIQAEILESHAHRLTIYLPAGKTLPSVVDHAGWTASKPTEDAHFERKCQLIRPSL